MEIRELLKLVIEKKASDLHFTENEPPLLRIDGALQRTSGEPVSKDDLKRLIYSALTDMQKTEFERELELDFSLALPELDRFRVNVHMQRGSEEEALIISIEDPIEFLHSNKKSIIKQREIFSDTKSFASALRHSLREDPNVIIVGEMRDLETISTALTAAETGHLVLATLHTPNAPQTIQRIIDVFPANQQTQIKLQLADCLQAVLSQLLLPHISGKGRVMATEIKGEAVLLGDNINTDFI